MRKKMLKRIFKISGAVFLLLVAVLVVHIYMVTRPQPITAKTIAMARIDIKQPITTEDAKVITEWLYKQNGVDHVLCNPQAPTVVFTFHPLYTNANTIAANFKSQLNYKGERFIPTEKEMKSGCPVAETSWTYKIYKAFRSI